MRKTAAIVSAAALSLGLFATSAAADDDTSNPAVNRNECAEVGGEFTQEGRGNNMIRTCTVGGGEDTFEYDVPGSHPQQEWTVDLRIPGGGTVYTFQPSVGFDEESTGESGEPVVIACRNSAGNEVEDFETNPHCQPSD